MESNKYKFEINLQGDSYLVFVIVMALFSETCLNGYPLMITAILSCTFIFRVTIADRSLMKMTFIWLMMVFMYILVLGLIVPNNEKQFSYIFNITVFVNVFFTSAALMDCRRNNIYDLLHKILIYTFLLSTTYIFANEFNMIRARWLDFMRGTTGYRLGISSNINPNTIAWLYGFLAIIAIYLGIQFKQRDSLLIYLACVFVILCTGSKNGLICAAIPLVVWGITYILKLKVQYIALIVISVVLFWHLVQNVPILYTVIGRRIDQFMGIIGLSANYGMTVEDASTIKRMQMIKKAFEMFNQKPVLGWGMGAFSSYGGFDGFYSHNNYTEILVSGGIVLFVIYYGFVVVLLGLAIMSYLKNRTNVLPLFLVLSNLSLDIGSVSFYSRYLNYFKYVLAAAILAVSIKDSQEEITKSEQVLK